MKDRNEGFLQKKASDFIRDNPELAGAIYEVWTFEIHKEAIVSCLRQKAGNDFVHNMSGDDLDGLAGKIETELFGNQLYWDAYYKSVDQVVDGFVRVSTKDLAPENPDLVAEGIDKAVLREILEKQQADRVEGGMFGIVECKKSIQAELDRNKGKFPGNSLSQILSKYVERAQKDPFFNKRMVLACWEMMDRQERVRILGDVELKAENKQQRPLDHAIADAAEKKKKVPHKSGEKKETQDREQF